jgi:hypothetical protein
MTAVPPVLPTDAGAAGEADDDEAERGDTGGGDEQNGAGHEQDEDSEGHC